MGEVDRSVQDIVDFLMLGGLLVVVFIGKKYFWSEWLDPLNPAGIL